MQHKTVPKPRSRSSSSDVVSPSPKPKKVSSKTTTSVKSSKSTHIVDLSSKSNQDILPPTPKPARKKKAIIDDSESKLDHIDINNPSKLDNNDITTPTRRRRVKTPAVDSSDDPTTSLPTPEIKAKSKRTLSTSDTSSSPSSSSPDLTLQNKPKRSRATTTKQKTSNNDDTKLVPIDKEYELMLSKLTPLEMELRNKCSFSTKEVVYARYHDMEWGKPLYDSRELFELMALESQHTGLSWVTILRKRESYRKAFHHFDPYKIAQMSLDTDVDRLMEFPDIVHHRKKIEAIILQARGYIQIEKDHGSFSNFIWSVVDHKPIDLDYSTGRIVVDERSTKLSKILKQKYGCPFLGPVTVYAFFEAAGLYNAHQVGCPCNPNNIKKNKL